MEKVFYVVENSAGTVIKGELTTDNKFDYRYIGAPFPFAYGFLPNTKADDGDPIDCFILPNVAGMRSSTGQFGYAYHVATINCVDNGVRDDKYILSSACWIAESDLNKIYNFLNIYKNLFLTCDYKLMPGVEIEYDDNPPVYFITGEYQEAYGQPK